MMSEVERLKRLYPEIETLVEERGSVVATLDDGTVVRAPRLRGLEGELRRHRGSRTRMSKAEMREIAEDAERFYRARREESERANRRPPPLPPPMYGA